MNISHIRHLESRYIDKKLKTVFECRVNRNIFVEIYK